MRILEWVAISLLRGIFPIYRSNLSLPHCRQILYCLSYQRSPVNRHNNNTYWRVAEIQQSTPIVNGAQLRLILIFQLSLWLCSDKHSICHVIWCSCTEKGSREKVRAPPLSCALCTKRKRSGWSLGVLRQRPSRRLRDSECQTPQGIFATGVAKAQLPNWLL